MKRFLSIALMTLAAMTFMSCSHDSTPEAEHVIFVGIDCFGASTLQRAETPNINRMIDNGAIQLYSRCVRETSSSQNWMSILSGASIEMHGVTGNAWDYETRVIEPAVKNNKGMFPTIFDHIKEQRPDAKVYAFYNWKSQDRMYDTSRFDKTQSWEGEENDAEVMDTAIEAYVADQPEFMYVYLGKVDHIGHSFGNESDTLMTCMKEADAMVGKLVKTLEEKDMMKNTVIILTGDHGGFRYGHGGDSKSELEVPIIVYGEGVTKGKYISSVGMNFDVTATIAGLMGIELPSECRGRFLKEAWEPKDEQCYVPMPMIRPFGGMVKNGETVTLTCDWPDVDVYYTLDGTEPTKDSQHYTEPFALPESTTVKAVAFRNGQYSEVASCFLYAGAMDGAACINYRLFRNYKGEVLPDFGKIGAPDATGTISVFTLDELPIAANEDDVAVLMTSNIVIPETGLYRFALASDDGSRLLIDGKVVVDNNGSHSLDTKYGVVELTEGKHNIVVEYFEDCDGQFLELLFGKNDGVLRPVTATDLEL